MIRYKCGTCGARLENPDDMAGRKDRCPGCGTPHTVPLTKAGAEKVKSKMDGQKRVRERQQRVEALQLRAERERRAQADEARAVAFDGEVGLPRETETTDSAQVSCVARSVSHDQVRVIEPVKTDGVLWYCRMNEQQYGPVTAEAILKWRDEGMITDSVLVWCDGMENWLPFADISEFHVASGSDDTIAPVMNLAVAEAASAMNGTVTIREYKVLSQKDKWLSRKFDPAALEVALNAYADQGWRVRSGDTASFPGILTGHREELITILEREAAGNMSVCYEYKVLSQKDKWFSSKFDPQRLEQALNAYADQGWNVVFATTATFPGLLSTHREEMIVILERRRA